MRKTGVTKNMEKPAEPKVLRLDRGGSKRISAFPNWATAEVMIKSVIAPEIRARVWRSVEAEGGTVRIMFLPEKVFYLIPPEDADEFERRYNKFAEWAGDSLGLYDYFEKNVRNRPTDQRLCAEIELDVNMKIDEYNCTHWPTITEKFIEIMTDEKPGDVRFIIKY